MKKEKEELVKFDILSNRNISSSKLENEILSLKDEFNDLENKISSFESILRAKLIDQIIEEQELSVLYKKMQNAKKQKRLEQKKRGKNYKQVLGLNFINTTDSKSTAKIISDEDKLMKKKLYREAMMEVHPDKFSMDDAKMNEATSVASKLIEIYKTGNYQELKNYHSHIFANTNLVSQYAEKKINISNPNEYLHSEITRLKDKIRTLKSKHIYNVLISYEQPLHFIDELRFFYADRLSKLRKRTRKHKE